MEKFLTNNEKWGFQYDPKQNTISNGKVQPSRTKK
jgi:hypothetical protein